MPPEQDHSNLNINLNVVFSTRMWLLLYLHPFLSYGSSQSNTEETKPGTKYLVVSQRSQHARHIKSLSSLERKPGSQISIIIYYITTLSKVS